MNCPKIQTPKYPKSSTNLQKVQKTEKRKLQTSLVHIRYDQMPYKYSISPGNNHHLVKEILKNRANWQETVENDQNCNFIYRQISQQIRYERYINDKYQKHVFNHIQGHQELSCKYNLIQNLCSYAQQQQIYAFDITPITFCIDYTSNENLKEQFEEFLEFFTLKSFNYFPNQITLTLLRKNFYYSKQNNMSQQKLQVQKKNTQQNKSFYNFASKKSAFLLPRKHFSLFNGFNTWMIKPAHTNRGKDIKIFNNLQQFNKILQQYSSENKNNMRKFVIQKYIESPLLIEGRKFDIRMWVLLTNQNKQYIFKEGYIRTSAEIYQLDEIFYENNLIHLTNNAIQKYGPLYGFQEQGNQLSFEFFDKYLKEKKKNFSFYTKIIPKIKNMVKFSLDSISSKICKNTKTFNSFEIFGYDFIIDNNYNPWLIEINTNPCIEQSSQLLSTLLKRMLDDAYKITIDKQFNQNIQYNEIYKVPGYTDEENLWEELINSDYHYLKQIQLPNILMKN